jgi:5-oxoprolinase (ATP-hydrolysing)
MYCAFLSGHRRVRPFVLEGGVAGIVWKIFVRRMDGMMGKLEGCDQTVLDAGEAVIIETPTAGGYGDRNLRG